MRQKLGLQCIQRGLRVSPRGGFLKDQIGKEEAYSAFSFDEVIKDLSWGKLFEEGLEGRGAIHSNVDFRSCISCFLSNAFM